MIVPRFNRWTKRRGRPNVQTWELSSQAPPDHPPPPPDEQTGAAYDQARIASELAQAQAALDVAHSYSGRNRGRMR
jgi:hypothetical protein